MPALLAHEGVWQGSYRTVNLDGETTDLHDSRVECVFPDDGPFHYEQRNRFEWPDGRVHEAAFGGVLKDRSIHWDTDSFSGRGWTSGDRIVLLKLDRKDEPDVTFTEIIVLGEDGVNRGRTWHWFRDGVLFQRTLCNEYRVT